MRILKTFWRNKRKNAIQEALKEGAVVVDVRSAGEFTQGHFEGSINIPLSKIAGKIEQLRGLDKPIVLCCASGMRSAAATAIIKGAGGDCYDGGSWLRL